MNNTITLIHRRDMRCETALPGGRGSLSIDSLKHRTLPDFGLSPLDLLGLAHGACTAMLLAMKAGALGVNAEDLKVEVRQDYDDGPPMMLKTVHIRFLLAQEVTADQEEELLNAAKTCPVHTSLRSDISVLLEIGHEPEKEMRK